MAFSEPGNGRRLLAAGTAVGTIAGLLLTGGWLAPPGSAAEDPDPIRRPPALRLAAEPGAGVSAVDVPLRGELAPGARGRYRTPRMGTTAFSMVGFTWRGRDPGLRMRVRSGGSWGGWQRAEPLGDVPDRRSREARNGRSGTDLVWVGRSDAVQVESSSRPARSLEMTLIEPGGEPVRSGPTAPTASRRPHPARAPWPQGMRSRGDWGADDRLVDGPARYNRTIQQVHVHHTASSNRYHRQQVPGMIRGMLRYHTQNLGWSDIGYNFLVDRFGRTWVGRAGGPGRPVRGAHTLGFNRTSTGVAVIGNFESARPSSKVKTAIVQLAAWKLDKYGRKANGTAKVYSHGSDRFPAGRRVRLPVIDGHRDTNQTACPGAHLYSQLPKVRKRTAARMARFD